MLIQRRNCHGRILSNFHLPPAFYDFNLPEQFSENFHGRILQSNINTSLTNVHNGQNKIKLIKPKYEYSDEKIKEKRVSIVCAIYFT